MQKNEAINIIKHIQSIFGINAHQMKGQNCTKKEYRAIVNDAYDKAAEYLISEFDKRKGVN